MKEFKAKIKIVSDGTVEGTKLYWIATGEEIPFNNMIEESLSIGTMNGNIEARVTIPVKLEMKAETFFKKMEDSYVIKERMAKTTKYPKIKRPECQETILNSLLSYENPILSSLLSYENPITNTPDMIKIRKYSLYDQEELKSYEKETKEMDKVSD